ncbi:hypothetical protein AB0F88_09490 [Streptosporangium sp. NPDC023963]
MLPRRPRETASDQVSNPGEAPLGVTGMGNRMSTGMGNRMSTGMGNRMSP